MSIILDVVEISLFWERITVLGRFLAALGMTAPWCGEKGKVTRRRSRLVTLLLLSLLPPRHSEGAIATEESPYETKTFIYE